jgi:hypothetical protein
LKEPTKKKYTNDHLGYLLAITTLKRVLSMSEISMLIEMDKDVSTDKSVLYGFFKVMAKDILQESAAKVSDKTNSFVATYNREKVRAIRMRSRISATAWPHRSPPCHSSRRQHHHLADDPR